MERYELTEAQFRSLARGQGSAEAVALLVDSQVSKHRLFLLAVSALPGAFDEVLALITRIDRQAPAAARDLLRHPFLDAWFARVAPALTGAAVDDQAREESVAYLGALAAAAAISGGVPFTLAITTATPDLVLAGLGTAVGIGPGVVKLGYDGVALTLHGDRTITVAAPYTAATSCWRPAVHVRQAGPPALSLELIDADRLRDRYAQTPLPAADRAGFGSVIERAWALLVAEQPEHAAGLSIALRALVPLQTPESGAQASASARDAFGAIGMSVSGDPAVVAELLVHEFQHEKLGALLDLVELCHDRGSAAYHAPWRLDPRPAPALAQGTYAFAGVAGFWRARMAALDGRAARRAAFQFVYWREQTAFGLDQLLGSGELTDDGSRFFAGLRDVVRDWRREPAPQGAVDAARLCAAAERISWRLANHRPDADEAGLLADAWLRDRDAPPLSDPVIMAGDRPRTRLPDLVAEHWLAGTTAATGTDRLILGGAYEQAAGLLGRALAARDDDADSIALGVALAAAHDPGAAIASGRPELLRAVVRSLRHAGRAPEVLALARWLK